MAKRNAFILLLSIFCAVAYGQSTRVHSKNNHAWFMYFGNHKVSEKFGIHAEAQWRRSEFVSEAQQLLLRTGVDYYLHGNSRLTVGYAFIQTYPYGDFAVPNAFPEHRIWQQFTTAQSWNNLRLAHRYRLEQRMIGNAATGKFGDGRYENRFRYMAKVTLDLSKGERPLFVALYDEVFINFGKDVAYNLFDQNRAYAAIGFTLSPAMKLETGYLLQTILQRTLDSTTLKNNIESNHTIQVGLFWTAPVFRDQHRDK
jgi:hypothetical protein